MQPETKNVTWLNSTLNMLLKKSSMREREDDQYPILLDFLTVNQGVEKALRIWR